MSDETSAEALTPEARRLIEHAAAQLERSFAASGYRAEISPRPGMRLDLLEVLRDTLRTPEERKETITRSVLVRIEKAAEPNTQSPKPTLSPAAAAITEMLLRAEADWFRKRYSELPELEAHVALHAEVRRREFESRFQDLVPLSDAIKHRSH